MKAPEPATILVLGLGNVLLGDEGVGVRALELLRERHRLPPHVGALDGGTLGMHLFPYLDGCDRLLILDAVQTGGPPGTPARLTGAELDQVFQQKLSMHQAGVPELLALGRLVGNLPSEVVVCGLQPLAVAWGLELSPPVAAQLGRLVDLAVDQLRCWGCKLYD